MENKRVTAHPNSELVRVMPKMLEDKKWLDAYLRGEITKEELESKGVKLVRHV